MKRKRVSADLNAYMPLAKKLLHIRELQDLVDLATTSLEKVRHSNEAIFQALRQYMGRDRLGRAMASVSLAPVPPPPTEPPVPVPVPIGDDVQALASNLAKMEPASLRHWASGLDGRLTRLTQEYREKEQQLSGLEHRRRMLMGVVRTLTPS